MQHCCKALGKNGKEKKETLTQNEFKLIIKKRVT